MKTSLHLSVALCLALVLTGCNTTGNLVTAIKDFAVGVYKATPSQVQVASARGSAYYKKLSPKQKTELKDSGTRYLAVRTSDPTPEQMVEIRKEMKKPGGSGRYGGGSSSRPEKKVYCVMIWDTYTQDVVGNNCYAIVDTPSPGTIAQFDTFKAQYVTVF